MTESSDSATRATAALRDWPCTNADHLGLCSDDHVHAAHIPYEGTDCTPDEAVEAVEAVRATAALTARCPVCHRRQRVLCLGSPGHRFAIHQSGSRQCSGSGTVAP